MNIFKKYADYYNLLYQDKDYNKESKYFLSLLLKYSAIHVKSILNLGCGTGRHEAEFLRINDSLKLTGIDISKEMISQAKKNNPENKSIIFEVADAKKLGLNQKYDAVVSLFHVMSYQTSNKDFLSILKSVKNHLNPHGVFLFDCWYGPGVLTERPEKRTKTIANDRLKIKRTSTPKMLPEQNLVQVDFDVEIVDLKDNEKSRIKESHIMRYFFNPEIELLANAEGFKVLKGIPFLEKRNRKLNFGDWNAVFILQLK